MQQIFTTINLKPEYKYLIEGDTKTLVKETKKLFKSNKYDSETLFALLMSCFQKLDLHKLFKTNKSHHLNNYQKSIQALEEHNKELKRRGLSVVNTLNFNDTTKHLLEKFDKHEAEEANELLSDVFSEKEKEEVLSFIIEAIDIISDFKPALFQKTYLFYLSQNDFTDSEKENIKENLLKSIDENFLLPEHFLGTLEIEGFYPYSLNIGIKRLEDLGEKGFSPSYCYLGEVLEKTDIYKAIYYYNKAYLLKDTYAAHILGFLHLSEMIKLNDPNLMIKQGIEYLKFAANNGDNEAAYKLGTVYYEDYLGLGVKTENLHHAIKWLRQASKTNKEAFTLLGHIYFKLVFDKNYYHHALNEEFLNMSDKDFKKFLKNNLILFIKDKDKDRKQINFDTHPGISVHTQYCLYYLTEGVKADILQCFYYLGYFYGVGVSNRIEKNYEQCFQLLEEGAKNNHDGCKSLLNYFKEQKALSDKKNDK